MLVRNICIVDPILLRSKFQKLPEEMKTASTVIVHAINLCKIIMKRYETKDNFFAMTNDPIKQIHSSKGLN
jgi:hypothetical protein